MNSSEIDNVAAKRMTQPKRQYNTNHHNKLQYDFVDSNMAYILDIFITNRPSLTSHCHTLPGLGDHHAISIHSSAQAHRAKPIRRKIHLWRHADIDKLKQDARRFTTSFTETFTINSSIHTMWDNIKSNLTELHEQHTPSKFTTTRFHQPWITTEIKRITRRKQRAYNRCKNKPTTSREHKKYKELQKQTKELCL